MWIFAMRCEWKCPGAAPSALFSGECLFYLNAATLLECAFFFTLLPTSLTPAGTILLTVFLVEGPLQFEHLPLRLPATFQVPVFFARLLLAVAVASHDPKRLAAPEVEVPKQAVVQAERGLFVGSPVPLRVVERAVVARV
eukprot:CAMPEP_0171647580 /NCGR_PEP_ID=MMETSP0990-20121206/35556_1 /TAXON_ID=483369 /ORGANISM="non described non described, Strain CCMP2098" /LENGTH=139 /DNA_ID=CAMNT_0012224861 /DNA_START=231 /DNA_END=648 /DNA_ORIENTATION=+